MGKTVALISTPDTMQNRNRNEQRCIENDARHRKRRPKPGGF